MAKRITPAQIRGARAMLDWSMTDLARAARVSVSTVKRMEMREPQPLSDEIFASVRAALEEAGTTFVEEADGAVGLRLRAL